MVIYSQRLAAKLMLKGFVLQGLEKHKNNSGRNVFYFKDSEEITKEIQKLTKSK